MATVDRHLRADAERNRRKLLEAAEVEFRDHGLDACVTDIAGRAGVGRGTVFRHFPTKEHLIAAIVVKHMHEAAERGRARLEASDPDQALFEFLEETVGGQQLDRALVDAVGDTFLGNPEIRAALAEVALVLDAVLLRAQEHGTIRRDIGALDVLTMTKGVCQATSYLRHIDPEAANRQFDLVRAALRAPSSGEPLRGRPLTLEDIERAFAAAPGTPSSGPAAARRGRSAPA